MTDLILHHYESSPFSKKVRLVLGYKQLPWSSVTVPVMNPKPDVVALTGGYRRTPFMQIGRDVYCDSALMCRVIDRLAPHPSIYPLAAGGVMHMVAAWADSALFWAGVPAAMAVGGAEHFMPSASPEFLQAFAADRAAMTAGMRRAPLQDARAQLANYLAWLEAQLSGGQPFLLGAAPCIADFSAVQTLWFMRRAPKSAALLAGLPLLNAWADRVLAFGDGQATPMASEGALALAKAAQTFASVRHDAASGLEPGTAVVISALDYAADPVAGTLVGLDHEEAVVARVDERAGTVHVHFPRVGFQVRKEQKQ
jgi:glutathione S-transferase